MLLDVPNDLASRGWSNSAEIDWTSLRQPGTVEKTRVRHRTPPGKTTSGLVPPRWNSTELGRASLEQSRGIEKRARVCAGRPKDCRVRLDQSFSTVFRPTGDLEDLRERYRFRSGCRCAGGVSRGIGTRGGSARRFARKSSVAAANRK